MTVESLVLEARHLARLPVFPLPGVVFFPHTLLPLHIFEPRYRSMIAFCLEARWPLAVSLIRPGHEAEQPGNPPMEAVAGVGRIVQARPHADGRYDIVLEGLARVRLTELPTEKPYRVARAELVPDVWPDAEALVARRLDALHAIIQGLRGIAPDAAKVLGEQVAFARGPAAAADTAAASLFLDPVARQRALETAPVDERLSLVVGRLTELLAEAAEDGGLLQ